MQDKTTKEKQHLKYLKYKERALKWEKNKWKTDKVWRDNKNAYTKRKMQEWRIMAIGYLGGVCLRCGYTDIRSLQIDHVNGEGKKDRDGKITGFYKRVLNDKSGKYQCLCANCNIIKRIENGEHAKRK